MPRGQPAPGLRPDDRLGPGRPAGPRAPATTSNYISVAGALHGLGQDKAARTSRPTCSATSAAARRTSSSALLAALLEAPDGGTGQVVDAAIVDGTAHLNAMTAAFLAAGGYTEERAANLLDGGAPYYDLYETADGRHMSVGALEPQFYDALRRAARDRARRPPTATTRRRGRRPARRSSPRRFRTRTQAEWIEVFEGTDACVAGVVPISEAAAAPAPGGPGTYVERDGDAPARARPALLAHRRHPDHAAQPRTPAPTPAEALAAWGVPDVDGLSPAAPRSRPEPAPQWSREAVPLPRHPPRGRRRRERVRRGAAVRGPRRARRTPGPARARRAGHVDLDDWSGIVLGGGPFNVSDPTDTSPRCSTGSRPSCAGWPCSSSRRTSRSSAPATGSAPSAPCAAGSWTGPTASRSARWR